MGFFCKTRLVSACLEFHGTFFYAVLRFIHNSVAFSISGLHFNCKGSKIEAILVTGLGVIVHQNENTNATRFRKP
jgi:hypothetical protein